MKDVARELLKVAKVLTARSYEGFYEVTSGSAAVWVSIGGTDEMERPDAVESYLKDAERHARGLLKKAGIKSRGWEAVKIIAATSGKVSGIATMVGDPIHGMSDMSILRQSTLKEGRP
jgi:hypothetical protein